MAFNSTNCVQLILLSSLVKLGSCDPQIALILLRICMCGGFTKLVHVARSTPPSLALDELHTFDEQVRCTFTECRAIDTTDSSWMQAQLSLSRGGLGLRSLAHHSNAVFIASISTAALPHHQIISWPMRSIPTTGVFPLRVQSILTVLLLLLADNTLKQSARWLKQQSRNSWDCLAIMLLDCEWKRLGQSTFWIAECPTFFTSICFDS